MQTLRSGALVLALVLTGCGDDDGGVAVDAGGRDAGGATDAAAPADGSAPRDAGGADDAAAGRDAGSLPPPGDIGAWTDAPGACPGGATRVDITTSAELEAAARGEGAYASDAPATCYFVHDGTYTSSSNVMFWVRVGGSAGAPRRFVGESRAGVHITQRATIEVAHVVIENMTFDLSGYVHAGAFNTMTVLGASDLLVSHVTFTGDCATGSRGGHVEIEGSDGVMVEACIIERFGACTGDGHLDHGVYLASGTGIIIRNNVIRENASRGIQFNTEGGSFGTLDGVTIERNRIYGNGHRDYEDGIVVNGSGTGTIQNVLITRNLVYGNRYSGIRFVGSAQSAIVVEKNTFHGNGLAAAGGSPSEVNLDDVGSGAGTMVRSNIFSVGVALLNNCYDAAPRGFAVADNVVHPGASFPACVTGAAAVDPAFADADGADFHPTAPGAMAYGAYAP